jgi:hypothetical protein
MQLLKEREADADKGVDTDWSPVIVGGTYEARASASARPVAVLRRASADGHASWV